MPKQDPLDFLQSVEYLEQPEATGHADYRRRLLVDTASRRRVDLVWRIRNTLRDDPQSVLDEPADESAITDELRAELSALSRGELDDGRRTRLREALEADPALMREALELSLSETASSTPSSDGERRANVHAWFSSMLSWRVPAWAAACSAAVLVIAIVALAPFGARDDTSTLIAAYRDDPVIRFADKDALPGMGFFADAQTETRPFAGVEVRLRGKTLELEWPRVAGADGYTVQVFAVEQRSQREIVKSQVAEASAILPGLTLSPSRRYEWVISGTVGERKFSTRGGFVLR